MWSFMQVDKIIFKEPHKHFSLKKKNFAKKKHSMPSPNQK